MDSPDTNFVIRPMRKADIDGAYRVCLLTGDSGASAEPLYSNPRLLGEVYVGPYFQYCPENCFILENPETGEVVGYTLGTPDTISFTSQLTEYWFPVVRARLEQANHASTQMLPADQEIIEFINDPQPAPAQVVSEFPAHGHIDLLPQAQGRGYGNTMMNLLLESVHQAGASGLYLEVSEVNARALHFYEKLGFHPSVSRGDAIYLGKHFT